MLTVPTLFSALVLTLIIPLVFTLIIQSDPTSTAIPGIPMTTRTRRADFHTPIDLSRRASKVCVPTNRVVAGCETRVTDKEASMVPNVGNKTESIAIIYPSAG
jgi:hypothetical protein